MVNFVLGINNSAVGRVGQGLKHEWVLDLLLLALIIYGCNCSCERSHGHGLSDRCTITDG